MENQKAAKPERKNKQAKEADEEPQNKDRKNNSNLREIKWGKAIDNQEIQYNILGDIL